MLVFEERGKPEFPGKNLSEQRGKLEFPGKNLSEQRGKPEFPGKNLSEQGENRNSRGKTSRSRVENQQTQPTYGFESGNRSGPHRKVKGSEVLIAVALFSLQEGMYRICFSPEMFSFDSILIGMRPMARGFRTVNAGANRIQ